MKKNDGVDLTEVNSNIEKRLSFLRLTSSANDDGHHKISVQLDFVKSGEVYYGIICVKHVSIPELFAVTIKSNECRMYKLTDTPITPSASFGRQFNQSTKTFTLTNSGNTDGFYLDIFNYPY